LARGLPARIDLRRQSRPSSSAASAIYAVGLPVRGTGRGFGAEHGWRHRGPHGFRIARRGPERRAGLPSSTIDRVSPRAFSTLARSAVSKSRSICRLRRAERTISGSPYLPGCRNTSPSWGRPEREHDVGSLDDAALGPPLRRDSQTGIVSPSLPKRSAMRSAWPPPAPPVPRRAASHVSVAPFFPPNRRRRTATRWSTNRCQAETSIRS